MDNYFKPDELKCKCCGESSMDVRFMVKLNAARYLCGFPFVLNSAYRCREHNKAVGSTSGNHVTGKAADIRCLNSHDRFLLTKALLDVGMLGIGIGPLFIHADINRETPMIWLY